MTNILVTGGTGFIGSNLVKQLINQGNNVRIFDNNFRGNISNLPIENSGIEFCEGDIRIYSDVEKAVKDIDTVFHMAFINGTENFYKFPDLVLDVGIRGHLNIMDACVNSSVKKFVYASSSEIYQIPDTVPTPEEVQGIVPDVLNPRYSYGGSKLIGELLTIHYARESNIKRIIFRPHNIYGPAMGFEHVIPQIVLKILKATNKLTIQKNQIEIQGTGMETRAFCYVDDAVDGIILAGEKGNNTDIFNVGIQQETSIKELIQIISNILEVGISIVPGELQKGSTPRRCPDISKLSSLGYTPKVALEDGLRNTVTWYRDYYLKHWEI